mmetsp:Transcript_24289/g.52255  ORF Transcript_24289/g.52255 Transcript_24289/m.52255 type:complete len:367 (-) Transcript_24289:278-1378(-)
MMSGLLVRRVWRQGNGFFRVNRIHSAAGSLLVRRGPRRRRLLLLPGGSVARLLGAAVLGKEPATGAPLPSERMLMPALVQVPLPLHKLVLGLLLGPLRPPAQNAVVLLRVHVQGLLLIHGLLGLARCKSRRGARRRARGPSVHATGLLGRLLRLLLPVLSSVLHAPHEALDVPHRGQDRPRLARQQKVVGARVLQQRHRVVRVRWRNQPSLPVRASCRESMGPERRSIRRTKVHARSLLLGGPQRVGGGPVAVRRRRRGRRRGRRGRRVVLHHRHGRHGRPSPVPHASRRARRFKRPLLQLYRTPSVHALVRIHHRRHPPVQNLNAKLLPAPSCLNAFLSSTTRRRRRRRRTRRERWQRDFDAAMR